MSDKFEKIKTEVRIADVVERFGVKLNYHDKGLCPFHKEKTPSFSVDRKTHIFTCFGCGETGDVIKNESLYSGDYREMGKLKDFADKNGICLLFVHHLRKQLDDGDVFNMISGSTALMGAADSIFIISKKTTIKEFYAFKLVN